MLTCLHSFCGGNKILVGSSLSGTSLLYLYSYTFVNLNATFNSLQDDVMSNKTHFRILRVMAVPFLSGCICIQISYLFDLFFLSCFWLFKITKKKIGKKTNLINESHTMSVSWFGVLI